MNNQQDDLITIKEAANIIDKTIPQIRYLVKYDKINHYNSEGKKLISNQINKDTKVSKNELINYLKEKERKIKEKRKESIGDYHKELTFDDLREKIRTKHVHRLHPYKGKFIPQLVEYFLKESFDEGDYILDPFMGSGTTLVQAEEMGINAAGIDISPFNYLIAKVKTDNYDIDLLEKEINNILRETQIYSRGNYKLLDEKRKKFKRLRIKFNRNEMPYIREKYKDQDNFEEICENKFKEWVKNKKDINKPRQLFEEKKDRLNINIKIDNNISNYLKKWFAERTLDELLYYKSLIDEYQYKNVLKIILSRSARSCRLVHHYDLTDPEEPAQNFYYCYKHRQICEPIEKAVSKIKRYSKDTIKRIKEFDKLKSSNKVKIFQGDAREIKIDDIKFDGIFTSPPYVGIIDYHEQHRYAYELLNLERYDRKEIGSKKEGQSKRAKDDYVDGISKTLVNLRKFMKEKAPIFIVANDKFNLYPQIAEIAEMEIKNEYIRPVSNRTSRDRNIYSEKIFEMYYK